MDNASPGAGALPADPLRLALLAFSSGRTDAARASCRGILRNFPENAAALHLLGLIEHRGGNHPEALRLLRLAAESPETTALYLLSYAELCCKPIDIKAAVEAAQRAVALDSTLPLGWLSLGGLLQELRQFEEAQGCFEQALRLDPQLWRASCGLAAVLQDLGRYAEALKCAEEAAAQHPDVPEPTLRAADIEVQMARYSSALARLQRIEKTGTVNVRALTLKAHALRQLDRFDEAAELCRQALAQGHESAELMRAYGLALQSAGRDIDALAVFDDAAAANCAAALSDKGVLLTQLGRVAEACEAFDQALLREPSLADARYNKANARIHRPGDPDIAAMEQMLGAGCCRRDQLLLHFALGKAHMDAGHADAAFAHWHAGNQMKRAMIDYDPEAHAQRMASIAARPADPGASDPATGARLSELPVFVVGMPRCGSSLLEQILASHPEVHGAGELLQLRSLFENGMAGAETSIAESALRKLRSHTASALRVIDKDLANFAHLGFIHRVFPRARIIHCRRDPLDTCFSAYTKLFAGDWGFTYDLGELGRYYRSYHALMNHWRTVLPRDIFLEIDYETLVADPQHESRRVLEFLGLPWNDACLRFFETRRRVSTASVTQVRQPVYRSSIGRTDSLRSHLQPLIQALGDLGSAG
jgi:tetratricopeptide (TPR) repeat protein